jgi:hypothetical protein
MAVGETVVHADIKLEEFYTRAFRAGRAISAHLPRLRALADGCDVAIEFGVKKGGSASALLLGAKRVISYDIIETAEARALQKIAGPRWDYRIEDSRAAVFGAADLLFVDSLHTYAQVKLELQLHAAKIRRWLVFHDSITFGSIGADGETGAHLWTYERGMTVPPHAMGIRPAIDEMMAADPSWRVVQHYTDSHGLLVLERR